MNFLWTIFGMTFVPIERVDHERDAGIAATLAVILLSIAAGVVDHFRKRSG